MLLRCECDVFVWIGWFVVVVFDVVVDFVFDCWYVFEVFEV